MIETLNSNGGIVTAIGVIVGVVIAIIGFFINKNITKIRQSQKIKNKSKGLQGGRDAIDNSVEFKK
jgi:hypothetical protein